jgi:hypothetical protein
MKKALLPSVLAKLQKDAMPINNRILIQDINSKKETL